MSESKARLILWSDGAYACTTHDARTGTRMLVQFDGKDASRICRVARDGCEETVTRRSTLADGVALNATRLATEGRSSIVWSRTLTRPGLHRRTRVRLEGPRKIWEQHDRTDRLDVVYRHEGAHRYGGEARDRAGRLLWRSAWEGSPERGWRGTYSTPDGRPAGSVTFEPSPNRSPSGTPGGRHGGGPFGAPWSGGGRGATGIISGLPGVSSGIGSRGSGGRGLGGSDAGSGNPASIPSFAGLGRPGAGVGFRWDGPGSRGHGTGGAGGGGISMQGPGGNADWTWGSTGPGWGVGAGGYTTNNGGNVQWVSVSRPGRGGTTHTTEWGTQQERGHEDRYTIDRTTNSDGSSSFTRTSVDSVTGDRETSAGVTDRDGNQSVSTSVVHADGSLTLETTTVDKDGNGTVHTTVVDKDGNVVVDETKDVGSGSGSGGGSGGGSNGDSSMADPNGAGSGSMSAPDVDGMPSDGGVHDMPGRPGAAGTWLPRDMREWLGAAVGGEPVDDREGGSRADDIARLLEQEIRRGGVAPDGGHDTTGWGAGESRRRILDVDFFPPENEDEVLNHPQALVAHVAQLLTAAGVASGSANLIRG